LHVSSVPHFRIRTKKPCLQHRTTHTIQTCDGTTAYGHGEKFNCRCFVLVPSTLRWNRSPVREKNPNLLNWRLDWTELHKTRTLTKAKQQSCKHVS
jgi:hypothetical protein